MSEVDTGGPAFPAHNFVVPQDLEARHVHKLGQTMGMTLRDYFAAKALPGVHAEFLRALGDNVWIVRSDYEHMAHDCYRIADAMLKARGEVK
jgi:hypothetical protein